MQKNTVIIDAKEIVLGRLSTKVASILIGKDKPNFSRNIDNGDSVVVINASKIILTGKKLKQKFDFRHSGYPRGDKLIRYDVLMKEKPERVVELAVKGMLPKNRLGRKMFKKLRVFRGGKW